MSLCFQHVSVSFHIFNSCSAYSRCLIVSSMCLCISCFSLRILPILGASVLPTCFKVFSNFSIRVLPTLGVFMVHIYLCVIRVVQFVFCLISVSLCFRHVSVCFRIVLPSLGVFMCPSCFCVISFCSIRVLPILGVSMFPICYCVFSNFPFVICLVKVTLRSLPCLCVCSYFSNRALPSPSASVFPTCF